MNCPTTVVSALLLVSLAHASVLPGGFGYQSMGLMQCSSAGSPCRLRIESRQTNSSELITIDTEVCRCPGGITCSEDWSLESKIVTRSLISSYHSMDVNMMFCNTVQPKRACNMEEPALVVSGSSYLPTSIESFNCFCNDPRSLQIHVSEYRNDFKLYQSYVCDSHKVECPRHNTPCMMMTTGRTDYQCKCASGYTCEFPEVYGPVVSYGYCRRQTTS